jgi:hypothetical protein
VSDESAFPIQPLREDGTPNTNLEEYGLTKREYFAALAMQAMIGYGSESSSYRPEKIPSNAVEFADALIAELEKK